MGDILGLDDLSEATRQRNITTRNADALAEALRRLLVDDGYARELGARAREAVVNRFSVEAATPQWRTLYEDLKASAED